MEAPFNFYDPYLQSLLELASQPSSKNTENLWRHVFYHFMFKDLRQPIFLSNELLQDRTNRHQQVLDLCQGGQPIFWTVGNSARDLLDGGNITELEEHTTIQLDALLEDTGLCTAWYLTISGSRFQLWNWTRRSYDEKILFEKILPAHKDRSYLELENNYPALQFMLNLAQDSCPGAPPPKFVQDVMLVDPLQMPFVFVSYSEAGIAQCIPPDGSITLPANSMILKRGEYFKTRLNEWMEAFVTMDDGTRQQCYQWRPPWSDPCPKAYWAFALPQDNAETYIAQASSSANSFA